MQFSCSALNFAVVGAATVVYWSGQVLRPYEVCIDAGRALLMPSSKVVLSPYMFRPTHHAASDSSFAAVRPSVLDTERARPP